LIRQKLAETVLSPIKKKEEKRGRVFEFKHTDSVSMTDTKGGGEKK